MAQITYQNFGLTVARKGEFRNVYTVSVQGAPGGDASAVEFTTEDLRVVTSALTLDVSDPAAGFTISRHAKLVNAPALNPNGQLKRVSPPSIEEAKKLGSLLFNAIFKERVRDVFNASLGMVRRSNSSEKLRLQLNLTRVPELAVLPWEYIYNPTNPHFYAQSAETPIVRYLEQDRPIRTLKTRPPLRVLVAVSSPAGPPKLDSEQEWQRLKGALAELEQKNLIELDRLEKTTLDALRRKLKEKEYNIFHFIGHGSFADRAGVLLFEGEQGQSVPVNGNFLGRQLANYETLRLAIINACEGASSSNNDSYAGVAQNLLQYGNLPAVIAMQFAISDRAAVRFADVFYASIARGFPVDFALSVARTEMIDSEDDLEWATPVLFMRASDGELFDLSGPADVEPPPSGPRPSGQAHPLHAYYQDMIGSLRDGQLVFFLGLEVNLYGRKESPEWQPGPTLPTNGELAAYLARELQFPLDGLVGVASVSQKAFVGGKKSYLSRILGQIFTHPGIQPSPLHKIIARLFARIQTDKNFLLTGDQPFRRSIIVTTTYDNLLERAFIGEEGGERPVPSFHVLSYQADEFWAGRFVHTEYQGGGRVGSSIIEQPNEYKGLCNDTFPIIIKLPGAIVGQEFTYAIAEDNFFPFAGRLLPKLLPPQLMVKLQNSRHLYLGYKVRDWTLRSLLYSIWGTQRQRMESWAVLPDAHKDDRHYWESCDVRVIETPIDYFIDGFRERIESL